MAKINGKYINDIAGDLSPELQTEYQLVKQAYLEYKAIRDSFEGKVRDTLGNDNLVFSYRFGRLSATVGEPKAQPKPVKPRQTLADWLAQQ